MFIKCSISALCDTVCACLQLVQVRWKLCSCCCCISPRGASTTSRQAATSRGSSENARPAQQTARASPSFRTLTWPSAVCCAVFFLPSRQRRVEWSHTEQRLKLIQGMDEAAGDGFRSCERTCLSGEFHGR